MALSGQLSLASLGTVAGTNRQVLRVLVPQTDALRAAFASHFGKPLVVTDGYRPYEEQVSTFLARYTPARTGGGYYGDIRWWNGVRYVRKRGFAAAAVPGASNHGWGQALDLGSGVNSSLTSPEYLWMRANASAYGWSHPAWARNASTLEPWHWEALPTPVSFPGESTGGTIPTVPDMPPLTPIEPEDDFMSALTAEEQRRLLSTVDTLRSFLADNYDPAKRINRVGDTQAKVDLTFAQTTNVLNGVVTLLGRPLADVDEASIATALTAALTPLLGTGLTEAQVVAAVKSVFADAAS